MPLSHMRMGFFVYPLRNAYEKQPKPIKHIVTKDETQIRKHKMTQNNHALAELEKRLWGAADQLRANSSLTAQEYSRPVLGLIFLKYADHRFSEAEKKISKETPSGRRTIGKLDYQDMGVMYLPEPSRYSNLITMPEGSDIGKAINDAMDLIKSEKEDLKGGSLKIFEVNRIALAVEINKTNMTNQITETERNFFIIAS